MKILGLKLTHDASFSIIDDNKLKACIELEKIDNNQRNTDFIYTKDEFNSILRVYGYDLQDFDKIVIDGWYYKKIKSSFFSEVINMIELNDYGVIYTDNVFPYVRYELGNISYFSTYHLEGHLWSAYCTSPFARLGESSFILIWDGGMLPHLFYFDQSSKELKNLGNPFYIIGLLYSFFATHFEPFLIGFTEANSLSVAGKVMAYIALGKCNQELLSSFNNIYNYYSSKFEIANTTSKQAFDSTFELSNKFVFVAKAKQLKDNNLSAADILATVHSFLGNLLLNEIKNTIDALDCDYQKNLCYAGGTALNIKWNNTLRQSNVFKDIWIPPFPNDSGSSIGAACRGMIEGTGNYYLHWNVYCGPALKKTVNLYNWHITAFSMLDLAYLIYETNEPIVFLNGAAEIGPRALGNRSILAQATNVEMKQLLNDIKQREDYRPVAPICMEQYASEVFTPGTPDPYMLYEHQVNEKWLDKVPAICHIDGTARLQTVNETENKAIYQLLEAYYSLTGIPLLCNTSANYKGKGFFPDIESVINWGKVNYIYSEGFLYHRKTLRLK